MTQDHTPGGEQPRPSPDPPFLIYGGEGCPRLARAKSHLRSASGSTLPHLPAWVSRVQASEGLLNRLTGHCVEDTDGIRLRWAEVELEAVKPCQVP